VRDHPRRRRRGSGADAACSKIRLRGWVLHDSDRAAGVFGVTGTGFAVLLAFVIFLSFSSYDRAREKASLEAVAVSQLYRTAMVFSLEAQRQLHGELICYARAVVNDEWATMRDRRASPVVDEWLSQIEQTIDRIRLQRDNERVAYEHGFDQMAERREGRRGRLTEAEPLVPPLVWLALILGGALVVAYMCLRRSQGARGRAGDDDRRGHDDGGRGDPRRPLPRPTLRERKRQHRADRDDDDAAAHGG
jgi:hypothetical protein